MSILVFFRKPLPPPPWLPKPTQLLFRRLHGLRTFIRSLGGTLLLPEEKFGYLIHL